MTPEEKARKKIDKQLSDAGWGIVSRNEYVPNNALAVKEALMQGNTESDYLLFLDNKAIAVVEAKKEENPLGNDVAIQAEGYATNPQDWYGLWIPGLIPLVYLANGKKILFKNLLADPDSDYVEIKDMHSPKKMLKLIGQSSEYGALPLIVRTGLRDCQYRAEVEFEKSLKLRKKKALAVLATGSGKTFLACLASYRLLNYTSAKRVLFLVDRNNLAKQTESEFSQFDRTETRQKMNSLYHIERLKTADDVKADIVVSTIQKLFAVLTGQAIPDDTDEDIDNNGSIFRQDCSFKEETPVDLGEQLLLPKDHFDLIIVDECHRSIYGKWQSVLNYFTSATILGLTATPTPEAYAFFNKNIIEEYTYEDSVVDGVNVPARVYRIITEKTVHGGTINEGETLIDEARGGSVVDRYKATNRIDYSPTQLDRSVVAPNQIETVIRSYMDAIYDDLYPERVVDWRYIPKTLIFAKNDHHATEIVTAVEKVFKEKFDSGCVPEGFVQKITYSAGDSTSLIRELRTEKNFRIAVTVTLVATGTDVKPLEVVLFMNDVKSEVLYTQMKGRGCRTLNEDKLREVTPNADNKNCFFIVDAVGVTESDKHIPKPSQKPGDMPKQMKLPELIEHLSHGEVSDDNLSLLRDYLATIHKRYEDNNLHGRHLTQFITDYQYSPRDLAGKINTALTNNSLPPYESVSEDNGVRMSLIDCLICNLDARNKLLEMYRGYLTSTQGDDQVIYTGFSKEAARQYTEAFEKYLEENKDKVEALRIIYNSEDAVITHSMLKDLRDKLISQNSQFAPEQIWQNYSIADDMGNVEKPDKSASMKALANLIQLVRYAYHKSDKLTSIIRGYSQRFALYCGQIQRDLTASQMEVMKQIADYIIMEGSITLSELNGFNPDLWREAIRSFQSGPKLAAEIIELSKIILKAA